MCQWMYQNKLLMCVHKEYLLLVSVAVYGPIVDQLVASGLQISS